MLSNMGAKGNVTAIANQLSETHIAYLRHLYWAHMIAVVDDAVKKSMPTPKFGGDLISRVTMIGARTLTEVHRLDLLQAVLDGDVSKVRAGVRRFDDLRTNLSQDVSDKEFMKSAESLLKGLDGRVPQALSQSSDLPTALNDFLRTYGAQGYQLGLRPADEDLARVIKDEAGNTIGVRSWVDHVMDTVPVHDVNRARSIGKDLTRGIASDAIARSAAHRFVAYMGDAVGMSEKDSMSVLREVRKIADENRTTARGLSLHDYDRAIAEAQGLDPKMVMKGYRSIADGIMSAYEGELRLVGATQALTGRAKTVFTHWGNFVGLMSERFYPLVRFFWNPVFIAQEKTELPFFLITRGQYPTRDTLAGLSHGLFFGEHAATRETFDEKTKFLMDWYKDGSYIASDMVESTNHVRRGFEVANRIANRKTPMGRWTETAISGVGHFFDLRAAKEKGERLVYRNRMGEELRDALMAESPASWYAARATYPKEMNDGEFAISWLFDTIARNDPESVWTKTSPDLFRPTHLGRRAQVSPSLISHLVSPSDHLTLDGLRAAVRDVNDPITTDGIVKALEAHGADAHYIERARWQIEGPAPDEWYRMLENSGVPHDQVVALRAGDVEDASRQGIGLSELHGRRWADAPQSMDQFGDQQGTYAFQLIVDSLEARGLTAPARDSPLLQRLTEHGDTLTVHWDDYGNIVVGREAVKAGVPGAVETASLLEPSLRKARAKVTEWQRARDARALDPTLGMPPMVNGRALMTNEGHTYGEVSNDQWLTQLEHHIPDPTTRREYADWYTDMQRGFLALFSDKPEEEQVRQAARMIVSFGVTQLNTSPALGMEFLYRVMSMARRGEDWPSVLGLTAAEGKRVRQSTGGLNFSQLQELLMAKGGGQAVPEQLGQKLADFIDSLIGKKERSVGIHGPDVAHPWQPVAGDIWAKRDLGFVDPKIGSEVWRTVPGARSSRTIGAVKRDAKGVPVRDAEGDVVWQRVDRIEAYDEAGKTIFTIPKEQIGEGAPNAHEYDYIVQRYNEIADHLNQIDYLNRTWTAADVQAMGWFRSKLAFGDTTGDPRSAIYKGRWNVASEINPLTREYAPPPRVPGPRESWMAAEFRTSLDENLRWGGFNPDDIPFHDGEPNSVRSFDAPGGEPVKEGTYYDPQQGYVPFPTATPHRVYVYYDDSGQMAGYALMSMRDDGTAGAVNMVEVRSDARRQGVGSAMYNQAEQDGVRVGQVTGKHGLLPLGEVFSPAYRDRVVPYSELLPPGVDLSHDSVRYLNDRITIRAHRAAMADSGTMSPRMTGQRFWDGRPVAIDEATGHYTTTLPDGRYSRGRVVDPSEYHDVRNLGESLRDREFKREPLTYADDNMDALVAKLSEDVRVKTKAKDGLDDEWGGGTIDAKTGGLVDLTKGTPFSTAVAQTTEVPIDATKQELHDAIQQFVSANRALLEQEDHYLGIFRDPSKGTIDLDVNRVVYSEQHAEALQTAYDRKGGAYNFDTGNGVYPAITRDMIGTGKNTTPGFRITPDGHVMEAHTIEVLGDRSAAEQYALRLGLYAQQPEVLMVRDTNVKALDYAGARGKGNIGGMVRVPVSSPEEGEALLRAINEGRVPGFPAGAHTAQSDDGSWIVQAMWDPGEGAADGRAFKKATKDVAGGVSEVMGRRIEPELTPVEFIRVKNDWATHRNGEDYLGAIGRPSQSVSKFGREFPTVPSETAGELEHQRIRDLVAGAETDIQQTVPREAAGHRTGNLYNGPVTDTGTGHITGPDERLASAPGGVQFQRAPTGTRAAIVRASNGRDTLYFGGRRVRVDSLLHEIGHKVAFDLDPSAIRRIRGIKQGMEGMTPGSARAMSTHHLTEEEHEWFVHQFLLWAKDPDSVHVALQPLMEVFRRDLKPRLEAEIGKGAVAPAAKRIENAKAALAQSIAAKDATATAANRAELRAARDAHRAAKAAPLDPEMKTLFDELSAHEAKKGPVAHFDSDEDAMFTHATRANLRATRSARETVHMRSDRSVVERSLNHPFLGLYPLSYMYGKVLPELIEFLMFRPFGLKAPLAGLAATNRMYQSFIRQQGHDENLREYLYKNEPAFRFLSMFVPGVPWDIPVNLAFPIRRLLEAHLQNAQRIDQGLKPLAIDYGKILGDVIGYQVGPTRSPMALGQLIDAAKEMPGLAGAGLTGRVPTDPNAVPARDVGGPLVQEAQPPEPPPAPPAPETPTSMQVGPATVPSGAIAASLQSQVTSLEEDLAQYNGG
jgi:GNAT superfamily N-acetyltransferase